LRFEQYYSYFAENGYDLATSSFVHEQFWNIIYKPGHVLRKAWYTVWGYLRRIRDLLSLRCYDIVYLHLWATPLGPPVVEFAVRQLAKRLIYDIDDMIFLDVSSRANPLINKLRGRRKPLYLMKQADHVIVGTPALESIARQYNRNVTDISATICTAVYVPSNRYGNEDSIVLGWSGSHSTSQYLYLLNEVFRRLAGRLRFRCLVIGDPDFVMEGVDCEAIPWNEASEVRDLQRIDIGLYPLPDDPWVHGKSGGKAVQYMALGIPTIATDIAANRRIIEDSVSGFLVRTDDEWLDRIEKLAKCPELRSRIGHAAREVVVRRFSVNSNRDTYLSVLRSVQEHNGGK
jgi:glycosyltransferase involved in cell wall biosynthesis